LDYLIENSFIKGSSGIETEGLTSDNDRGDTVSDAEEMKNLASEIEYSIFTETEDESKSK
jgi:hypothetical protein